MAILGAYEGLVGLVEDKTDEFEGLVAESWEANDDLSVWTFNIRPGIVYHDGTPVDAEAVRLNFERFLTIGLGPVGVLTRLVEDPSKISAPDASTLVFDLGKPQPLFESAIASTYGPEKSFGVTVQRHFSTRPISKRHESCSPQPELPLAPRSRLL